MSERITERDDGFEDIGKFGLHVNDCLGTQSVVATSVEGLLQKAEEMQRNHISWHNTEDYQPPNPKHTLLEDCTFTIGPANVIFKNPETHRVKWEPVIPENL